MTPSARVQAAIEIVDAWLGGTDGLDRILTRWGRTHRFAGSGDRHAIADLVYDALRRMRSAIWVAGGHEPANGRTILRGILLLDGVDPVAAFTGGTHAPAPLSDEEQRPVRLLAEAPRPVRLDFPDWLAPEFASIDSAALEALRARAPLDLRTNLLKTSPADAAASLASEGIETEPAPLSSTALRVRSGQRRLASSRAYLGGLVEIQDTASQAVVDLVEARPGETVLDLCAGGGGKTLALAAAMRGTGRIFAHDVAAQRIAGLPARAERAGVRVSIVTPGAVQELAGTCDVVLLDAPCSGSGVWRRNPDSKWRLTRYDLDRLTATQDALLGEARRYLRRGGRIAYATCSLLARENFPRIEAFTSQNPGWRVLRHLSVAPPTGDGFFAAVLIADETPPAELLIC